MLPSFSFYPSTASRTISLILLLIYFTLEAIILKIHLELGLLFTMTKALTALIHSKTAAKFHEASNYNLLPQILTASCKWILCLIPF